MCSSDLGVNAHNLQPVGVAAKEQQIPSEQETNLLSDIEASGTAVSTDELYDPDFLKKLIPVDELDDTLGPIVPGEGTDDE